MAVLLISLCRSRTFNQFSRSKAEYPVFYPHLRSNTFHKSDMAGLFSIAKVHILGVICIRDFSLFKIYVFISSIALCLSSVSFLSNSISKELFSFAWLVENSNLFLTQSLSPSDDCLCKINDFEYSSKTFKAPLLTVNSNNSGALDSIVIHSLEVNNNIPSMYLYM